MIENKNNSTPSVLIIGAGLSGLTLAYYLQKKNISYQLLEARPRVGGRIFTSYQEGAAPLEIGATWLGKKHQALNNLLTELDLEIFEQILGERAIYEPISTSPSQLVSLPPNNDPSYRIKGGSSALIKTLVEKIGHKNILLNQVVTNISSTTNSNFVKTKTDELQANFVVSTLPPFLLTSTIKFNPNLPEALKEITAATHTWMGESIKVGLRYTTPFWRAKNSSGTIFSNVGPIPEMYDHADAEEQYFSIKGFFNGAYFSISKEERLEMVLTQLEKYYGPQVRDFVSYEEGVWRNEPFTYTPYDQHVLPHQNNGHTIFSDVLMNGKFYLAGAETAQQYPGYMEGAVRSAQRVAKQIAERYFSSIS